MFAVAVPALVAVVVVVAAVQLLSIWPLLSSPIPMLSLLALSSPADV